MCLRIRRSVTNKLCRTMGKCRNTGEAMLSRNSGDIVCELIVDEQP